MDRDRLESIRAARGGAPEGRSGQGLGVDTTALANARIKFGGGARRATSGGFDVAALRDLGAKYRRKGA